MKTLNIVALFMISMFLLVPTASAQCGCQPTVTYYAPSVQTAYYAPTTTYYAPTAYATPVTTYYAPTAYSTYYAPTYYSSYYAPAYGYGRPGLFGWRARRAYRWGNMMTIQPY